MDNKSPVLNFYKYISSEEQCELRTNFNVPIILNEKSECCITDLSLPEIYTHSIDKSQEFDIEFHFEFVGLRGPQKPRLAIMNRFARNYPIIKPDQWSIHQSFRLDLKNIVSFQALLEYIKFRINEKMNKRAIQIFSKWSPQSFIDGKPSHDISFTPLSIDFVDKDSNNENLKFMEFNIGTINLKKRVPIKNSPNNRVDYKIVNFFFVFNQNLHNFLELKFSNTKKSVNYPFIKFNEEKTEVLFEKDPIYIRENISLIQNDFLFIRCNIIKSSYFNSMKMKILRVFNFSDDKHIYNFDKDFFVPITINEFDSILVKITDRYDQTIYIKKGLISFSLLLREI